jgi:hypothetical protein
MAELRTKLMTLAGIALMFAGMAHAQLTGCQAASNAVFVAAEGTVEQTSDITISCPAIAGAATLNLSVYLSPAVSVTSAVLGSGSSAKSETLAGFGALGGALAGQQNGAVSGSSVTFSGLVTTPTVATTITITNIKINASQIATSSGAPTAVTATIFVGGTNVTPAVLSAVNVAFAANGLASIKSSQVSGNSIASIPICTGVNAYTSATINVGTAGAPVNVQGIESDGPWSGVNPAFNNTVASPNVNYIWGNPSFNVQFSEGFATAFKTQGSATVAQQNGSDPGSGATANTTLGSEFTNNTYTGFGYSANNTTNQATSGTRIQVVLNNIPGNVTVYVPLQLNANGGQMILVNSATGAYAATTGSTANGAPGATAGNNGGNSSAGQLTVSNGSATAVYEETVNAPGAVESYVVPVYFAAGGAAVAAPSSAVTATVSFAPIGSSSGVPNFVSGSSTATVNGAAFSACSTTLLFPFVTNQLGFDTGIAIANTSSDLLNGGTKSTAAAQSGTCSLTFFGNTAPAAVTTASIASGTDYAAAASTVAPGFQGYMIASCNFLYGHGFAYVVYNLTQNNGAAMGYLADVIQSDRKSSGSTDSTVGSNVPEN